jgi:hypothetical protein
MVCYQVIAGDANAQHAARGKHLVVFDRAADKGAQLKAAQPDLGQDLPSSSSVPSGLSGSRRGHISL